MSEPKQQREEAKVTLDQLVAEATVLREYISSYEARVSNVSALLNEVRKAKEGIDAIVRTRGSVSEYMLKLDSVGLVHSRVTSIDPSKFLVHLGLNVYVEMDPSQALNYLTRVEGELAKQLEALRRSLSQLVERYNAIQEVISTAVSRARETAKQQGQGV